MKARAIIQTSDGKVFVRETMKEVVNFFQKMAEDPTAIGLTLNEAFENNEGIIFLGREWLSRNLVVVRSLEEVQEKKEDDKEA